jgi:hypothetical protein
VQNLQDLSNLELFFNGKTSGPGPQCRGPTVQSGPWCTEGGADTRHDGVAPACDAPGAAGLRSSPANTREEEGDEVVPVRGSPELRRWRRGHVTAVETSRHARARARERAREQWEEVRGGQGVKLTFL